MSDPLLTMKKDAIYMIPLGGCGAFGANMTLYGFQDQWIMVDCGMGFADETMPGVDILFPDPEFAISLGDKLIGIVLTHGHEDHIGAIDDLWLKLKKPLYATHFTAARIRQGLEEKSWGNTVPLHTLNLDAQINLGPFDIEFIRMAHSIPEANALSICVKDIGTFLHTGDWKIDETPVVGEKTNEKRLQELGQSGVLAVMGDSTNAMVPGHSGSEGMIANHLAELFGEFRQKILITCFSTNIARLTSIYRAAQKCGRRVCLVGRSLWSIDEAARSTGYLKDIPPFLAIEDVALMPDESVVLVCTGSQGESRAALSRISSDDHPHIRMQEGDVVIFSSRAIPGNERAIDRIKNRFYAMGVDIVTDRDAPIHVSGHPYRDELKKLYSWVKPRIAIPVHGERMQQEKHAHLAVECGVPYTFVPENGMVLEITSSGVEYVDDVPHGMLAIEGNRIVRVEHEAILTRRRMMFHGSVVVTVVLNQQGKMLAPPKVTALGLLDENSKTDAHLLSVAAETVAEKLRNMPTEIKGDDAQVSETVRVAARRFFQERFDRKPQTRVHLIRV